MHIFTDAERAYLSDEIRPDGRGRPILVGLTFEETAEFWHLVRMLAAGERLSSDQDSRYRVLGDKLNTAVSASRKGTGWHALDLEQ